MRLPTSGDLRELRSILAEEGTTVTLIESSLRGRQVSHNLPLNRALHVETVSEKMVSFFSSSIRQLVLTFGEEEWWSFGLDQLTPDAILATKQRPNGSLRAVFRVENVQQLADFDPNEEPHHERTNAVQDAWVDEA